MKTALSVFFNIDRTYLTFVRNTPDGLSLEYINSTKGYIDLEDLRSESSKKGAAELQEILGQISEPPDRLSVTIPAEIVYVSQFPGRQGMKPQELRQLVGLEIRQAYPGMNYEDFVTNIYPMRAGKSGKDMMMAVIISKEIIKSCEKLLETTGRHIDNIEISHMNAHTAFLYNYPDRHDQNVALLGIQENFIDVSVLEKSHPVYYNLLSVNNMDQLSEMLEEEFNRIRENYVDQIDTAFFFGASLTKELYLQMWETAMLIGFEAGRLNAFRMMSTKLDERARDYCVHTSHIYPPSIGGALPSYHKKIKLY
ncbi:MAG: hypothetical protein ACLFQX_07835 [Candidatus Kapaibacterium sp.]